MFNFQNPNAAPTLESRVADPQQDFLQSVWGPMINGGGYTDSSGKINQPIYNQGGGADSQPGPIEGYARYTPRAEGGYHSFGDSYDRYSADGQYEASANFKDPKTKLDTYGPLIVGGMAGLGTLAGGGLGGGTSSGLGGFGAGSNAAGSYFGGLGLQQGTTAGGLGSLFGGGGGLGSLFGGVGGAGTGGGGLLGSLGSKLGSMGLSQILGALSGGGGGSGSSGGAGGTGGGFGLNDLIGLIGGGVDASRQGDAAEKMLAWLNGNQAKMEGYMSPDSPEWKQRWEEMSRKDAAAGRNSQYGPRTSQFLSEVAKEKASNTRQFTTGTSRAYADALNQDAGKYAGLSAALQRSATGGGAGGVQNLSSILNQVLGGSGGANMSADDFWNLVGSDGSPIDYGAGMGDPTDDDVWNWMFENDWDFGELGF